MLVPDRQQQGFGLVEMLVAGFIIALGLVGMVLLQSNMQKQAFRAHHLALAGLYAQDLQERLRTDVCHLQSIHDETSEIEGWLSDHLTAWETTHFSGSRSGWLSRLNLAEKENGSEDWDESEAHKQGYWRFDLDLCFARCDQEVLARRQMKQQLLIEHRSEPCQ